MRIPMITRTIQTTKVSVLCLDVTNGEPCNMEVTLPRTYKDENAMLKAAKPLIETDTLKAVHIAHFSVCETLYGMKETDFIANAEVLPPRANVEVIRPCTGNEV